MKWNEQLTAARKARAMTQEQVAEAMNVSRQTVSHWENGRVKPDDEAMKRLTELLALGEPPQNAEEASAPKRRIPWGRLLAAFAIGVCVTLLAVYGLLPLLAPKAEPVQATQANEPFAPSDHPYAWYQQPAVNEAGKAYLTLTPGQTPVKLMESGDLPSGFKWNIFFTITETNGVSFTITKFSETYFNSELGASQSHAYTGAECTRFWKSALIEAGGSYGYNVFRPVCGDVGYGAAFEGFDANGNELAFGLYIPLSQEVAQTLSPELFRQTAPREDGKAYVVFSLDPNPIPLRANEVFEGGKGWLYSIALSNTGDAPFTLNRLTQAYFNGEQMTDMFEYDAAQLTEWWGTTTFAKGDAPLSYDGGISQQPVTGLGLQLEGVDGNGNELSFVLYADLAQEQQP